MAEQNSVSDFMDNLDSAMGENTNVGGLPLDDAALLVVRAVSDLADALKAHGCGLMIAGCINKNGDSQAFAKISHENVKSIGEQNTYYMNLIDTLVESRRMGGQVGTMQE